jgi:lysyl endopeptidase
VQQVETYAPVASKSVQTGSVSTLSFGVRPRAARVVLPAFASTPQSTKLAPAGGTATTPTANGAGTAGIPVQVGVGRSVAATADTALTAGMLQWNGASAPAAAISFTSPGASGLRMGLLVRRLPVGAVVRGYAQGSATSFEIPAANILSAIARNRDAGDVSDAGRTFWTPVVEGSEATLEITLPAGASPADVDVAVPTVSHLTMPLGELLTTKIGGAASCEVDVSCTSGTDALSRSVARMIFSDTVGTYACTGTLLNDSNSSGTPYFLSANHCISTQTVASSLNTYFFYRSTSCNSGTLNPAYSVLSGGATLLYASGDTDTSFMRLNEPAPANAAFAGWSVNAPDSAPDVVALHNPKADLQKYSQGSFSSYASCGTPSNGSFNCTIGDAANSSFFNAIWSTGTTEGGSSGSAAFAAIGGSRYVVGQLYGGSASCSNLQGSNIYGRLDRAYNAALSRWLSPAAGTSPTPAPNPYPTPVIIPRSAIYRFYNASTGAHFFTQSTAERDYVIAHYATFSYEGVAFYAYSTAVPNSAPVYRFYNTSNGRHFYTINSAERDYVLATYPQFSFEGTSWYAQQQAGGTAVPVYRFYNASKQTHFYTISAAEKDAVVQNYPSYSLEGVGYYAWTTQ